MSLNKRKVYFSLISVITIFSLIFYPIFHSWINKEEKPTFDSSDCEISVHPNKGNITTDFYMNASQIINYSGYDGILSYRLDWDGDGNWDTNWCSTCPTHHKYQYPGVYNLILGIKDESGKITKFSKVLRVKNEKPVVKIIVNQTLGKINDSFHFSAENSSDLEEDTEDLLVRWDWNNDGIWDTQWLRNKTVVHKFNNIGSYKVKLQVKDSGDLLGNGFINLLILNLTDYNLKTLNVSDMPYVTETPISLDTNYTTDEDGVILFNYNNSSYYYPGEITSKLLDFIESFRITNNPEYLNWSKLYANKLIHISINYKGALYFPNQFNFSLHGNSNFTMNAPWFSGVAQGQALSAFIRLYNLTKNESYIKIAEKIFASFSLFKRDNEIYTVLVNNETFYWIDEYPWSEPSYVLSGHIFGIYGLYDYFLINQSEISKLLLKAAISSVQRYIKDFRVENSTDYFCLKHENQSMDYHLVHIDQLRFLWRITGEQYFKDMADIFFKDHLMVKNTKPDVKITINQTLGKINDSFHFSAENSFDPEEDTKDLLVRWDWNNDGIWDTQWSKNKTAVHKFNNIGSYMVKLQVKDFGDLLGNASVVIHILNITDYKIIDLNVSEMPYATEIPYSLDIDYKTDDEGVILFEYQNSSCYHPAQIIQKLSNFIESFRITHNIEYLDRSELYANKLISLSINYKGALYFPYKFNFPLHGNSNLTMNAPWHSGMARGPALSAFIRLYNLTKNESYLRIAEKIFASFSLINRDNEVYTVLVNNESYYWIDEYPWPEPSYVLSGHIFGIYGLYDYFLINNSEISKLLLKAAISSVQRYIKDFRVKNTINYFCLKHEYQSMDYHLVHIDQLRFLWKITGEQYFKAMADIFFKDYLTVKNTKPDAKITLNQTLGTINDSFHFSAENSFDPEEDTKDLLVRWDWNNDGIWDTQWSKNKTAVHKFNNIGNYKVKLQVKDFGGLLGKASVVIYILNITDYKIIDLNVSEMPYATEIPYTLDIDYKTDDEGIILFEYHNSSYYHPVWIAQRILRFLEGFRITNNTEYFNRSELYANKLIDISINYKGALFFPYRFNFPLHGYNQFTMRAPWYSGMAQGQALSAFVRLYKLTKNETYLRMAEKIFPSFSLIKGDNKIYTVLVNNESFYWIDEYPWPKPTYVLNGHIFGIFGLYDYYLINRSEISELLLKSSISSVQRYINNFRVEGGISNYCLIHKVKSKSYHMTHIRQLLCLWRITGDQFFKDIADNFYADYHT